MTILSRIFICTFLGISAPTMLVNHANAQSAAQVTYQKGVDSFDVGDYRKAYGFWIDLAHAGHPQAMRSVALILNRGLGIQRDPKQAYQWYRKAAESGLATAQANTAFMLLEGKGIEKDEVEAAEWFKKAAEQNNSIAQYNLGIMYELGIGVPIDSQRSLNWYNQAAEHGHKRAKKRVAILRPKVEREKEVNTTIAPTTVETSTNNTSSTLQPITQPETTNTTENQPTTVNTETKTINFEPSKTSTKGLQAGALVFPSTDAEASTPKEVEKTHTTSSAVVSNPLKPLTAPENTQATVPQKSLASLTPKNTPAANPEVKKLFQARKAYRDGEYRRAATLWQELANQNNADAQFWLGRLYNRGEGLTLDRGKAYQMWRRASSKGHSSASTALVNLISRMSPEQIQQAEADLR